MFIPPAFAQDAAAGSGSGSMVAFALQMGLLFAAFYFLLIRPQQKRAKALRDKIAAVKKGDSIITAGGLIGKVTKVEDAIVEVEVATGVKLRVVKATIAEITAPGGAKPAND